MPRSKEVISNSPLLPALLLLLFMSCDQKPTEQAKLESNVQASVERNEDANEPEPSLKSIDTTTSAFYELNGLSVQLKQDKGNMECLSRIEVFKDQVKIDSFIIHSEPVGGNFGISKGFEIHGHLIFSKFGDYSGKTIVITPEGNLKSFPGGINFIDSNTQLLYSSYASDMAGFAVYDLKSDSMLLEMDTELEVLSFHKAFNDRLFISFYNDNPGEPNPLIYEIELELDRIMAVDLDSTQINSSNELHQLEVGNVGCICLENEVDIG